MQQFLLENNSSYRQWRDQKLYDYPEAVEQLVVNISNPYRLAIDEKNTLLRICQKTNLVFYKVAHKYAEDKSIVSAISKQLGFTQIGTNLCADQDRISSIQVVGDGKSSAYIPYTSKPLNWHTDGYYNQDEHRIRAFLMHCARPAYSGGSNTYLDPEIVYILLRDEDPTYIEALMDKNAMMIPANLEDNEQIRDEKVGPVFLLDPQTQTLYMRYTARSRNVLWKDNATANQARSRLLDIIKDSRYQFRHRLRTGEGVICNNVLHNRAAFIDHPTATRLLYRARFYDRAPKPEYIDDRRDQPIHVAPK